MTLTEFKAINNNVTVNVPVYSVKPGQKNGHAQNATASDLFVGMLGAGWDEDEDDPIGDFYRLNSKGNIETDENNDFMHSWRFKLKQLNYAGEAKITVQQWNDLTYVE